jgi:hypothetical protein
MLERNPVEAQLYHKYPAVLPPPSRYRKSLRKALRWAQNWAQIQNCRRKMRAVKQV